MKKFKCPECGWEQLEAVFNGFYSVLMLGDLDLKEDHFEGWDGFTLEGHTGKLEYYQCWNCGLVIAQDDDELKQWLEKKGKAQ